ncbi:MAG: hypothetical protein R2710_23665 [Acidimicrobiales bacterium]
MLHFEFIKAYAMAHAKRPSVAPLVEYALLVALIVVDPYHRSHHAR